MARRIHGLFMDNEVQMIVSNLNIDKGIIGERDVKMIYHRLLVELLFEYRHTTECLQKKSDLVSRPNRSYKLSNTHFKF